MTNSKGIKDLAETLSEALGQTVTPVDERIELAGDDAHDRVLIEQGSRDGLLHFMMPLHTPDDPDDVMAGVVNLLLQLNADVQQLGQARMAYNSVEGAFILMDQFRPDLSGAVDQLHARRALAQRIRQAIEQLHMSPEEA